MSESGIEAGMSTSHQLTKEMYQSYTDVCFDLPFKIKEIDGHGNPEISCISVPQKTPLGNMIETKGAKTMICEVKGSFNTIEEDYEVAADEIRRFKGNRGRNSKSIISKRAITPLCLRGDDGDDDVSDEGSMFSTKCDSVRQQKSQRGK